MSAVVALDTRDAVRHVLDAVNGLDVDAIADLPIDDALVAVAVLADAARVLAQVRTQVEPLVAEQMPDKQVTVMGAGTFERHRKTDRKRWDTDALLRVVLDSRVVDAETGEVLDETPLAKVLEVWNLGAPRVTAVRARGIDPDEFCTVERGAYAIQVVTS